MTRPISGWTQSFPRTWVTPRCASASIPRRRQARSAPAPHAVVSTPRRYGSSIGEKDEFLGILAHELRNPLAAMRFALDIMRRAGGVPTEIVKPRQVLERQVLHMVRIVDDLHDVSRITLGKVELRKELLQLTEIVRSAVELSRPA